MNIPTATQFEWTSRYFAAELNTLEERVMEVLRNGPLCLSRIISAMDASDIPSCVAEILERLIDLGVVRARPAIVRCMPMVSPVSEPVLAGSVLNTLRLSAHPQTSDQIATAIPCDRTKLLTALAELINSGCVDVAVLQANPVTVGYRIAENFV